MNFDRHALDVAPELIGATLATDDGIVVRIIEVEAYGGADDPASHAYRGRTARNAAMFGPAGQWYVYFTYGMHWCMNLVCGPVDHPSAVLLRAAEPVSGIDLIRSRRPRERNERDLLSGPARLAQALGVDRSLDGRSASSTPVRLVDRTETAPTLTVGPRIGIRQATDRLWRFAELGNRYVSATRSSLVPIAAADAAVRAG